MMNNVIDFKERVFFILHDRKDEEIRIDDLNIWEIQNESLN